MRLSSCGMVNRPEMEKYMNQTKIMFIKRWNPLEFHVVDILPKGKYLMQCTISNIFWNQFLLYVQNLGSIISFFMQTMPNLILLGRLKYFVAQIISNLSYIFHALRIWHHHTSIHLDIWSIVWKKFLSFRRGTSSRNSQNREEVSRITLEDVLKNWIDRFIWVDTWKSLLSLK
jgi:hypothetical protein